MPKDGQGWSAPAVLRWMRLRAAAPGAIPVRRDAGGRRARAHGATPAQGAGRPKAVPRVMPAGQSSSALQIQLPWPRSRYEPWVCTLRRSTWTPLAGLVRGSSILMTSKPLLKSLA